MKLWDILAPHFTSIPSTATRLRGPWSAGLWCAGELLAVAAISLLRIPGLSVSLHKLGIVFLLLVVWNLVCWVLAEVGDLNDTDSSH